MVNQSLKDIKNNDNSEGTILQMLQKQLIINHEQLIINQEQLKESQKKDALLAALTDEIKFLREQVTYLTNKLYGRSKETMPEQVSGQISLDLFEEPSALVSPIDVEETIIKAHKRKKETKAKKLADFPVKEVHHKLLEEERHCEKCGDTLIDISNRKVRDEVAFHQARIETLQHIQHSYCCKPCERVGETSLKKASIPRPLISNSLGSASIVTESIRLKFEQKVPAYRQIDHWKQLGLDISKENITNWHILVGDTYLSPLVERFHQTILTEDIAFSDETPYRVLESEKSKNYYWVFSNSNLSKKPVVIYHHDKTRKGEVVSTFMEGFKGYLHCDGYASYNHIPDVLPIRCWVHARRKFHEALPNKTTDHPAAQVLQRIQLIFKEEKGWKGLEPEERLEKRQKELKPLIEKLYAFIESVTAAPKSKLYKAIEYACTFRKDLERVLEDGRLALTNNQSEQYVKELVMGRRNYLFSSSIEGARALGHILSVIQTARQNGLNSSKHLQYLFEELPNLPLLTADKLDAYLPWSKKVQAICK